LPHFVGIGRLSRILPLGCLVVVVEEVDLAGGCQRLLPARRKGTHKIFGSSSNVEAVVPQVSVLWLPIDQREDLMLRSLVCWLSHDDRTGLCSVVDGAKAARGPRRGNGARTEGAIVQAVLSGVDAGALAATWGRLEEGRRKVPHFVRNGQVVRGLGFVDDGEHLVHHVDGVLPDMNLDLLLVLALVWGLGRHLGLGWLAGCSPLTCVMVTPLSPGHQQKLFSPSHSKLFYCGHSRQY